MFYISFTSKDRRGEEVPLKARLIVRHLPLERTISRQTSKKYPASYAQISVNTASQVTVRSHFPLRFFESTRIPHRILAKSLIPKIPFQTSLCSRLLRVTQKRRKSRSHYPCEIEIKISPCIVGFPVLKKKLNLT